MQNLKWRKSSKSNDQGLCVEVAFNAETVYVRDSKSPNIGPFAFTADEWEAFVSGVKNDEFDVA